MSNKLRKKILDIAYHTNTGHIGGNLSVIDILDTIFSKLKKSNEKVLLSKGHAALALYVCLNKIGNIRDEELATFNQEGTKLPAHPSGISKEVLP